MIYLRQPMNVTDCITSQLSERIFDLLEIPGGGANGTVFFRNFIPKFWVYLARLA